LDDHKHMRTYGLFKPLMPTGTYTYHLMWQPTTLHFVFMGFICNSEQTAIISLNTINQVIGVMVKCGLDCIIK
jgi:hypothetical protein